MKKRYLGLFLISLIFVSCAENTNSSIDDSSKITANSITKTMTLDYGNYIKSSATLLFGNMLVFFNHPNYGIDKLYAGDVVSYRTLEI